MLKCAWGQESVYRAVSGCIVTKPVYAEMLKENMTLKALCFRKAFICTYREAIYARYILNDRIRNLFLYNYRDYKEEALQCGN